MRTRTSLTTAVQTPFAFLDTSGLISENPPMEMIMSSWNTIWMVVCIKYTSGLGGKRDGFTDTRAGFAQNRGSKYHELDPGGITDPLAEIFGYVVGDIWAHMLEKFHRIWLGGSPGTRMPTGGSEAAGFRGARLAAAFRWIPSRSECALLWR